ncbi:hypothetical protein RUM43_014327 [Polyplax serrata]|uniref:Uncharacterized protein n=1 Tax=Polyplax serrata TaxID=468196 RepID=A0AAN8P1D6_POLSC
MSVHYVDVEEGRLPLTFSHVTKDLEKSDEKNKVKRHSIHGMMEEENVIRPHQEMAQLSLDEKKFLLAVERGDVASTRRTLQKAQETDFININCVDPLGRSALLMAIDNENLEMVELLIEHKVETKDALLHAISEEFVEAVEVLLDHENTIHQPGEPHEKKTGYRIKINTQFEQQQNSSETAYRQTSQEITTSQKLQTIQKNFFPDENFPEIGIDDVIS